MELREVTKQDEEEIIELYDEYIISELIPGIDRFEGIRDFNIASKKVIEKNGGIFENTYSNVDDGYTYLRYWIKI